MRLIVRFEARGSCIPAHRGRMCTCVRVCCQTAHCGHLSICPGGSRVLSLSVLCCWVSRGFVGLVMTPVGFPLQALEICEVHCRSATQPAACRKRRSRGSVRGTLLSSFPALNGPVRALFRFHIFPRPAAAPRDRDCFGWDSAAAPLRTPATSRETPEISLGGSTPCEPTLAACVVQRCA